MQRVYHQYHLWEDYKNGMYKDANIIDKDIHVFKSINLLKDTQMFYDVCVKLIIEWPYSSEENLTNLSKNRRAWLGAAACSFNHKCPEYLTRVAWSLLNELDKQKANIVADKVIKEYEAKNKQIHRSVGEKLLF